MPSEDNPPQIHKKPRGHLWRLIQSIIEAHTFCGTPYEVLVPPTSPAYEYFSEVLGYLPRLPREGSGEGRELQGDQDEGEGPLRK